MPSTTLGCAALRPASCVAAFIAGPRQYSVLWHQVPPASCGIMIRKETFHYLYSGRFVHHRGVPPARHVNRFERRPVPRPPLPPRPRPRQRQSPPSPRPIPYRSPRPNPPAPSRPRPSLRPSQRSPQRRAVRSSPPVSRCHRSPPPTRSAPRRSPRSTRSRRRRKSFR